MSNSNYLWLRKNAPRTEPASSSIGPPLTPVVLSDSQQTPRRGDVIYFLEMRGSKLWSQGKICVYGVKPELGGIEITEEPGLESSMRSDPIPADLIDQLRWRTQAGEERNVMGQSPPPTETLVPISAEASSALDTLA